MILTSFLLHTCPFPSVGTPPIVGKFAVELTFDYNHCQILDMDEIVAIESGSKYIDNVSAPNGLLAIVLLTKSFRRVYPGPIQSMIRVATSTKQMLST